jgi:phage major head subunit gpT-like protein
MIRRNEKRNGSVEVANPDLSGTGVEIQSALFVDLRRGIGRRPDRIVLGLLSRRLTLMLSRKEVHCHHQTDKNDESAQE